MKTRSRFVASIVATARRSHPPMPFARSVRHAPIAPRPVDAALRKTA